MKVLRHRIRSRVVVEQLDNRLAPAVHWNVPQNAGPADWSNPGSWWSDEGVARVPNEMDDVIIPVGSGTVRIDGTPSVIRSLNQLGGFISAAGRSTLEVSGNAAVSNAIFDRFICNRVEITAGGPNARVVVGRRLIAPTEVKILAGGELKLDHNAVPVGGIHFVHVRSNRLTIDFNGTLELAQGGQVSDIIIQGSVHCDG